MNKFVCKFSFFRTLFRIPDFSILSFRQLDPQNFQETKYDCGHRNCHISQKNGIWDSIRKKVYAFTLVISHNLL